jgi:hypothetical protein
LTVSEIAVSLQAYAFHGVTVTIAGDLPATRLLRARFAAFPSIPAPTEPELTFEFDWGAPDRPASPAPVGEWSIYDFPEGELVYCATRDELRLTFRNGITVVCDAAQGRVATSVLDSEPIHHWMAAHLFFTIPFIELLKRRGLYSVHAAGLCLDGQALLLAGPSGSGKSTLAVALIEAGFDFLGDDMLFLATDFGGVRILAFPDELDIAPDTAGLLPSLARLVRIAPPDGAAKHRVSPAAFSMIRLPTQCRPSAVIFPRVSHTHRSTLTPIDRPEALLELAPNVLLTEPHSSQAHLHALGRLVSESACFRLDTGQDLDRLPGLLRGLLG